MAIIETINSAINSFVWGVPMLVLLVGAGILLTCRTCGVQFRKFGYAMKNTAGKVFKKGEAKEGEITPFQAMSTALAGTVGTGNIAGVTTALTLGGPGSMFWLWITALIGMATKYSEVLLAVRFRERNKDGDWVGGPMYYIKNGLGKNWKWLGAIFCIFAALAAFGIALSGCFQALGNGIYSTIVSLCRQMLVLLPVAYLLSKTGEVNAVWLSFIIAEVISLAVTLTFFRRIYRQKIKPLFEAENAQ